MLLPSDNEYTRLTNLSQMQYKIIDYLMNENEIIWKILGHSEPDAIYRNALSKKEKAALIYNGQQNSTGFRVFMTDQTDDQFNDMCAMIRIYPAQITPINNNLSVLLFQIDCFSHVKINMMSNYATRTVTLLENVVSCLNGQNIDGIGKLTFSPDTQNSGGRTKAVLNLSNNKSFSGYSILMQTHI